MSLLVDYGSSSEDEAAPSVSASAPAPGPTSAPPLCAKSPAFSLPNATNGASKPKKKTLKKKKKTKTTLYLPPEIQRLLETGASGGALSDDSGDDNDLLAKHKRAKKTASKRPRPADTDQDSVLSFLPPPKHALPAPDAPKNAGDTVQEEAQEQVQDQHQATEAQAALPVDEAANAAAWQQYYQQQQQQYQATQDYYVAQGENDVPGGSSKRRRTRERDIELALQQGHFETVADQITEVQGPTPNSWQPPVDPLTGSSTTGSNDQEMKVSASFWNAQTGTKVSSVKPSRLQRQRHQLNQLAFDAKARDFELMDKRGASLKTKRETYAKYGW